MSTYGEQKKAWAKQWAKLRRDYLSGRLADAIVLPAEGGYRWDCPFCGRHGSTVTSEALATTAGRGHMQQHVSHDDDEALENLKVTHMPENLLTPYQRARRDRSATPHQTRDVT